MNIFDQAPEFVTMDNRRNRQVNQITSESMSNRLSVQLPSWLVKDRTVLDLGACLGAAGHWALTHGAWSYTMVEIQEQYVKDSQVIFARYWRPEQYAIVAQDIEEFLDQALARGQRWDIVVASGVLYAFFNLFGILEKIARVTEYSLIIDTMYVNDTKPAGMILIQPNVPINYHLGNQTYYGTSTNLNLTALDYIMGTNSFERKEDPLLPPKTLKSHDGYHDIVQYPNGQKGPSRYAARYYRSQERRTTLRDKIINQDTQALGGWAQRPILVKGSDVTWSFDAGVAGRFQWEAETNIPDYHRVIDLCLQIAKRRIRPDDAVVDVGSALGFTLDRFSEAGYSNIYGVEPSSAMIELSSHKDRIFKTDQFPDASFNLILINWTLHFILDKALYLKTVYQHLLPGGTLIISDKTQQSPEVKELYYDFKRANGVTEEYIQAKEQKLKGYMHTENQDWYTDNLVKIGFTNVQIINARLGFVTFLCHKP